MKATLLLKFSILGLALILCHPRAFSQNVKLNRQQTSQPTNVNADPDDGGEVVADPDDGGEIGRNLELLLPETDFLAELERDAKLITGNKKLSAAQKKSAFIQALLPAAQARKMNAGQFTEFVSGLAVASGTTACKATMTRCMNVCQHVNPNNKMQCQQNCIRQFLSCSSGTAQNFGVPIPAGTSILR